MQGNEASPEDMQLAVNNPAWAQQASSALAAATRERVELQKAAVEAEDCIVRYHHHTALPLTDLPAMARSYHHECALQGTIVIDFCFHEFPYIFARHCQILLCIALVLLTNTTAAAWLA